MKIVEQYGVPTIYVDDFCDHQIINGNIHAVGFREQREPGAEPYGVVEVRIIMNAKNFFAACNRGLEMAEAGGAPAEKVFTIHH